jgi:hypothetical protein
MRRFTRHSIDVMYVLYCYFSMWIDFIAYLWCIGSVLLILSQCLRHGCRGIAMDMCYTPRYSSFYTVFKPNISVNLWSIYWLIICSNTNEGYVERYQKSIHESERWLWKGVVCEGNLRYFMFFGHWKRSQWMIFESYEKSGVELSIGNLLAELFLCIRSSNSQNCGLWSVSKWNVLYLE